MDDSPPALVMPPRQQTAEGAQRRVGVELEMNGINLDRLSTLVAARGGYRIEQPGRCERRLTGDPAGDWVVELDSQWIKKIGREPRPQGDESAELLGSAEDALIWMAESL
ncbi:MAG TPA: alpha-L-fucosidase, partial [Pseudomonas sp.]|nr:alpha-L-fucosidase [Pseudomonas sp.]